MFADASAGGRSAMFSSCSSTMFERPVPRCNGRQGYCAELARPALSRLSWPFPTIGLGGSEPTPLGNRSHNRVTMADHRGLRMFLICPSLTGANRWLKSRHRIARAIAAMVREFPASCPGSYALWKVNSWVRREDVPVTLACSQRALESGSLGAGLHSSGIQ